MVARILHGRESGLKSEFAVTNIAPSLQDPRLRGDDGKIAGDDGKIAGDDGKKARG